MGWEMVSNKNLFVEKKDEMELLYNYRTLDELAKIYIRGITKGFIVSKKIANSKNESATFSISDNSIKQIALEIAKQLFAEEENKNIDKKNPLQSCDL